MASVKGNALVGLGQFVAQRHGVAGVDRWLEGSRDEDRDLVKRALPTGWYPVGGWNRLVDAYVDRFGEGDPQSFRPVAEYVALHDLTTIFKLLLKLATPSLLLHRAPSLWSRYFDVGVLEVQELSPRRFQSQLTAPLGIDDAPGSATCSVGVTAWLTQALKMTGAQRARVEKKKCRHKRARACEFEIEW